MGGHGSGGLRVGAGRKSKDLARKVLEGTATRRERAQGSVNPPEAVPMPAELGATEQRLWLELAPYATAARTLTPATSRAFRDLLQAILARDAMFAQIEKDGLTYLKVTVDGAGQEHTEVKAHPLISQHRGMMQRVEAGMARFRIAPTGKPIEDGPKPEDPFDEFEGPTH